MNSHEPASALLARQPVIEVVDEIMVPILRAKTEAERFAMAAQMWRFARDTYVATTRAQYPEWTAAQVQREASRRLACEV
jgi:hypothetical protein